MYVFNPFSCLMTDLKKNRIEPRSLKANAVWNSAGSLFYMGCQWLITVLVVSLSPNYDNSGILAFAMAVGLVFYAIGTYSIRPFQISDIKNEYSAQNYIAFRLLTNIGSYALCIIYLLFITQRWDLILASLLYLVFKFDESFSDVLFGIYQKNARMDYIGKSYIARGALSLSCFAISIGLTSNIFISIACMAASCIFVTFAYDIPRSTLFGPIKPSISRQKAFLLLKKCFVAMLANLMLTYVVSAVRQYYGIIAGDSELGIYAAIATPAVVVQASIGYIYTPFIVPLAEAFHKGRKPFLKYFLKILSILTILILGLSAVLCIVGPAFLILIFGESITSDIHIFPFVVASTALVGLLGYMFAALVTMRKMVHACIMSAIAFAISISSAIPFISLLDMNGINLGIIAGCISGLVVGMIFVIISKNPSWGQRSQPEKTQTVIPD